MRRADAVSLGSGEFSGLVLQKVKENAVREGFLYRTFSSSRFALKTGWRISKKRVILEFLHWAFLYVDWLIVSCVLIRFILDMAMKRIAFEKMMLYVWSVVALQAFLVIFERFFETYVKPVTEGSGGLSIEHVDFGYLPGQQVLKDVSFAVKPGQKIALVGYNGSGKTTLVKLLLRLYDPDGGKICYHGRDIRDYQVMAYRRSIGSVFQDFKLYAATLKENVLMDAADESREESFCVEQALYDAHFMLEDNRLSYQIETPLTTEFEKDGVNLSGGEAQKVAIARTLYRKQNMIIMDEPSSALDPLAEYRLNQELNEIARDKTVIFISHRLSTVRDADCIYMMENGRIVESGTHEALLAEDGKYAAMWKVQAGLYT